MVSSLGWDQAIDIRDKRTLSVIKANRVAFRWHRIYASPSVLGFGLNPSLLDWNRGGLEDLFRIIVLDKDDHIAVLRIPT